MCNSVCKRFWIRSVITKPKLTPWWDQRLFEYDNKLVINCVFYITCWTQRVYCYYHINKQWNTLCHWTLVHPVEGVWNLTPARSLTMRTFEASEVQLKHSDLSTNHNLTEQVCLMGEISVLWTCETSQSRLTWLTMTWLAKVRTNPKCSACVGWIQMMSSTSKWPHSTSYSPLRILENVAYIDL